MDIHELVLWIHVIQHLVHENGNVGLNVSKMLERVLIVLGIASVLFVYGDVIQAIFVHNAYREIILFSATALKNNKGFHDLLEERGVCLYAILQIAQFLPGHGF